MMQYNRFQCLIAACLAFVATSLLSSCAPKEITAAKIYLQGADFDKAVKQLEIAVVEHKNNPEAHFMLGQTYGQLERFKEMNHEFDISLMISDKFQENILSERERHWISKYNRALTATGKKDHVAAEALLRLAIDIDPTRQAAYEKLALTYLSLDESDKALLLYLKLLKKRPNDTELLSSAGNLHYSRKEYDKVIPILKRVLAIEPGHRDALANLALSYDALGEQEKAAAAFKQAIAANPQDNDLVFLFAVHRYNHKQYSDAIQLFEHVLSANPDDFESVSNIGNAYLSIAESTRLRLQQSRNGAVTADEVIELKNQAVRNYKSAIPYLEKSLELEPNHPALWRNLGIALINTGEKEKGRRAFLKAEQLQLQSAK